MATNKYEEFEEHRPANSENVDLFPDPSHPSPNQQQQAGNEYPPYQAQPGGYVMGNPYPPPQQTAPIVQQQMPAPLSYGIPIDVRQSSIQIFKYLFFNILLYFPSAYCSPIQIQ